MGVVALVTNIFSLPRWAHEREGQMEYLAGRVQAIMGPDREGDPESGDSNGLVS